MKKVLTLLVVFSMMAAVLGGCSKKEDAYVLW